MSRIFKKRKDRSRIFKIYKISKILGNSTHEQDTDKACFASFAPLVLFTIFTIRALTYRRGCGLPRGIQRMSRISRINSSAHWRGCGSHYGVGVSETRIVKIV